MRLSQRSDLRQMSDTDHLHALGHLSHNSGHLIGNLSRLYPEIDELVGRIESDYIDLKDIASSVDHSQDSLSVDPDRLSWVENRLDIYYSLQQKHRVSTAVELLALRDSFADKLTRIENFDEELSELRRKIEVRERRVSELVGKLSAERRKAADQIF